MNLSDGQPLRQKRGFWSQGFFGFGYIVATFQNQHQMLIDLEAQPGNQVYYIAQGFAEVEDLDQAYKSSRVVARSAMFSPTDIGALSDDDRHRISFRQEDDWGWFLSEPKRINIRRKSAILERALSGRFSGDHQGLAEWLEDLGERMVQIIRKYEPRILTHEGDAVGILGPQRTPLERVAYLARTYFGCELFLATEPRRTL